MDETSRDILIALADFALVGMGVGGLVVWARIFRRIRQRRSIIPYAPRRQVPWNGLDLLAILFGYAGVVSFLALSADRFLDWTVPHHEKSPTLQAIEAAEKQDRSTSPEDEQEMDSERAHPIIVLLNADSSPAILVLCMLSVVVVAPIGEEFLFRLLLQGYLERIDSGCRSFWRYSGRLVGIGPILLTSLLFAALHARDPRESPLPVDELIRLFTIDTFSKAIVVLAAILYLRKSRGATWDDLGVRIDALGSDLRLALAAFLAIFVPILGFQFGLANFFPDSVPDPLPLFPLALALGYLYFRTHRIIPSVLLHLAFNATSMALFFAWMASK